MPQPHLVELLNKWDNDNNGISPEESTLAARFEIQALRLLAEGHPVSAKELATRLEIPTELVTRVFNESQKVEGEWDEKGRLIGEALTLVPTRHHIHIKDNDLFAWCAFDTMLIPALVGDTADIESPDPLTGEIIHLTVSPFGVKEFNPATTVLSMVVSGAESTGPESDFCSQTHFFSSQESAEQWQEDHPDVTIMTVEEVDELIHEQVLAPMRKALEQLS
jgi:alkylmercury lyase